VSKGQPSARKREAAIAALLSTGTLEQAARKAHVSEKTLRLWLAQPAFAAEYRRARQQILEQSIGILQSASIQAVAALVRNLTCGRPGAEIAAAHHLLEHSLQAVQEFDWLVRLERLEQQAAQQGLNHASLNGAASNGQARGADR
jgi:hypothetical protein